MKIAVLTDSSSSIYNYNHNYDNLFLIDIPCFIGDRIFNNYAENKDVVFYDALATTDLIPKTSQPSVGETVAMYEHIKSLGYTNIIYLPISKELSGTYQNAYLAREMVEGITIDIVDTLSTVSILGSMALYACSLIRHGLEVKEIIDKILKQIENTGYYVTVNNLSALVKNGRLSNAKSIVANLLKIKPVIKLTQEGKLQSIDSVRTYKGAIKAIIDKIAQEITNDSVLHLSYTNNEGDMEYTMELLKERFPHNKIEVYTLPATVVAHLGLEAIALGFINYI